MIIIQLEFAELASQFARIHAQVNQRADEHVATDAAENVEVKGFHIDLATKRRRRLKIGNLDLCILCLFAAITFLSPAH